MKNTPWANPGPLRPVRDQTAQRPASSDKAGGVDSHAGAGDSVVDWQLPTSPTAGSKRDAAGGDRNLAAQIIGRGGPSRSDRQGQGRREEDLDLSRVTPFGPCWAGKARRSSSGGAATLMVPVLDALLGPGHGVALRCWDGSRTGPSEARFTIVVRSPQALARLVWRPDELGLARAYAAGELDVEGDLEAALALGHLRVHARSSGKLGLQLSGWTSALVAARLLGALGRPPQPPAEEARLRGPRHTRRRDAVAVGYHYDVSNEFYRLVLGDSLTYSCAYFAHPGVGLDDAQQAKHDLVCRKLGLRPGMRLLDVGCGWGSMVLHAARHFGVQAVGITVSRPQRELAVRRVEAAGLADTVEVRLQDYRDLGGERFDAISSIGMFEHVGRQRAGPYFSALRDALVEPGRLLNHAISLPSGDARPDRRSFIQRYVFPDGELHEVGRVTSTMQDLGLEVRDVESLREHYVRTLRHWVANLERSWGAAVDLTDEARARIWRLYMTGFARRFQAGGVSVHQILAVRPDAEGGSGMPATRAEWIGPKQHQSAWREGTSEDLDDRPKPKRPGLSFPRSSGQVGCGVGRRSPEAATAGGSSYHPPNWRASEGV